MGIKYQTGQIIDIHFDNKVSLIEDYDFHRAIFEDINLSDVSFFGCSFRNAHFYNVSLRNAHFLKCKMMNSIFDNCIFENVKINDSWFTGGQFLNPTFKSKIVIKNSDLAFFQIKKSMKQYIIFDNCQRLDRIKWMD